jgi:serine/threonine protein kinase
LEVAVKKIFNPNINEELLLDFNTEITMLSKYRHPNIVLMVGAVTCPPTLCIVMEYVKMSLYDVLHRRKQQLS